MRAAWYSRFGGPDMLEVGELPDLPAKPGFARVSVHAAAINPKDVLLRKGKMRWLGAKLPIVPGYDLAGTLIDAVPGLDVGSEVFGMIGAAQGGAAAEVAYLPAEFVAPKPNKLSMLEAASLPLAGLTAVQAIAHELRVEKGQTLLINGASGGVGTLAVQVAKAMGANVVAVCSGRNASLVTELGADRVVDYKLQSAADERDIDHVFDVYGTLPFSTAKQCLRSGGRYCSTIPSAANVLGTVLRRFGLRRPALVVVRNRRADLDRLTRWVLAGAVRPLVDRVFALENISAAHAYLETRRARGKVVLDVFSG